MTLQDAKESIDRYVEHGIPCGGFLTSVLENDLMGAMARADDSSRLNLHAICEYVYNDIPFNVHGSRERVEGHLQACRRTSDQGDDATSEPKAEEPDGAPV